MWLTILELFMSYQISQLNYSPPSSKLKRIISDSNAMLFKQYLNQTDFSAFQYIPCPNADYNTFISLYKNAFNTAFPLIETKLCKRCKIM